MRLGEYQKLKIIKKVDFGVYLAERGDDELRAPLPYKQVPEGARSAMRSRSFCIRIRRTG